MRANCVSPSNHGQPSTTYGAPTLLTDSHEEVVSSAEDTTVIWNIDFEFRLVKVIRSIA